MVCGVFVLDARTGNFGGSFLHREIRTAIFFLSRGLILPRLNSISCE
jgi:hypothetical protein